MANLFLFVSVEIVEVGTSYSIGSTKTVSLEASYTEKNIPYNGTIYTQSYEVLRIKGFEIYEDNFWTADERVGGGSAWRIYEDKVQSASWKDY